MPIPETVFARLQLAAHLRVSGPDAAAFLQGQFSNDLRRPEPDAVTYGLWLNHKGRVLADSHVLARGSGAFDVVSVSSPAAAIRARLEACIVADEVTIEDHSANWVGWVVAGRGAAQWLGSAGLDAPSPGRYAEADGALVFRGRAAGSPSWCVLARVEWSAAWEKRLHSAHGSSAPARELDASELAADRVLAGIASVPDELGPDDLPAEGGLEAEAVSFTKGCYLGQEVVARLRNLGQLRRRLFVLRWQREKGVRSLPAALAVGGRRVGELRSAFRDGSAGWVGLGMLNLTAARPGSHVELDGEPGASIEVVEPANGRTW